MTPRVSPLSVPAEALLVAVEQQELASLRWGYVDGSLGEADVLALAERVVTVAPAPAEPHALVEELLDHRLLFETISSADEFRLRSRFAESVRLLTRLRQLFPQRPWSTAPSLVSDFRVDSRPRMVPRRDTSPAEALGALGARVGPLEHAAAKAVLDAQGPDFALRRFQAEAAQRIFRQERDRGVVVSAGTGSGKTLAFYLPALAAIAPLVERNSHWAKAIALYPRNELLKDQFGEAFKWARALDAPLRRAGRRPLTIGTFFGPTPRSASEAELTKSRWRRAGTGFVCPFLTCPGCGGEMVWAEQDVARRAERLRCRNTPCGFVADPEHLVLTRERAHYEPPDIVFTSAEMLHQRISDTANRRILGIQPDPAHTPRFLLLDEVHIYEGTTGAQTALALRRWRHAVGRPMTFVGLSATLGEAPGFFAELLGLSEGQVREIAPQPADLEPAAMSHQLVLRGDPASQTSLLSTSIQTALLMARLLDPRDQPRSDDRYGNRLFVFTDDLDVTNRLFDDLRDAEAYTARGRRDPRRRPLADLRARSVPDGNRRDAAGQNWQAIERIGWSLAEPLLVSRTTSRDVGVEAWSNVVVATSALEVGFDDPRVGAVLQHKSPYRLSSFVQRRGRAGRKATMRSWMVTVLSDYGRDRLTFQAYEQLFSPALPAQHLPTRNRYVLRMQAVFAFVDWLAAEAARHGHRGWMWQTLNGPGDPAWERTERRQARKWVQETLKDLSLGRGDWLERLGRHLGGALHVCEDEVQALLWEPPRSLLLEAVPTLIRRLATDWTPVPALLPEYTTDLRAKGGRVHPLPDFVPESLFSELNVPEVAIVVPPGREDDVELMPIGRALDQLAPGRVTRRFASAHGELNHWMPVPIGPGTYELPIDRFAEEYELVAEIPVQRGEAIERIACFRPHVVKVEEIRDEVVLSSSNARLDWRSMFEAIGDPVAFPIAARRGWGAALRDVDFFLHVHRSAVRVKRFAMEAKATLYRSGVAGETVVRTLFRDPDGGPAAVGFEQDSDGLRLRLQLPSSDVLARRAPWSENLSSWRTLYFRDRVLGDPDLEALTNWFQRDWLQQIYLSALVAEACRADVSLEDAQQALRSRTPTAAFDAVTETIFRIQDPESSAPATALELRLRALFESPLVLDRLHALAAELWSPDPARWEAWLRDRVHETLGEAALMACTAIAPQHAVTDNLLLDLGPTPVPHGDGWSAEVWITESTPGGTGMLEAIAQTFAADQRTLFTALDAAITPSDLEIAVRGLDRFLRLVRSDQDVADAVARVRGTREHGARARERSAMLRLLGQRGLGVHHSLSVALEHRLLREGMDPAGDELLEELLELWRRHEARLGIAIDLRVFSFVAVTDPVYGPRLGQWLGQLGGALSPAERVGVLAGVLWPRAAEIRGRSLESYNRFREQGRTDPSFVRDLVLGADDPRIAFGSQGWLERVHAALSERGAVRVTAAEAELGALRNALLQVLASPVDVDFLQFYPVVERVDSGDEAVDVLLVLREIASA